MSTATSNGLSFGVIVPPTPIRHLVVSIVFDPTLERVLLVRKIVRGKMRWMNGRLNGPGGHVEPGESHAQAAYRELEEETGIVLCGKATLTYFHTEKFESAHVHFFYGRTSQTPYQREAEPVFWLSVEEAINDPALIDNLRVLIPAALKAILLDPAHS